MKSPSFVQLSLIIIALMFLVDRPAFAGVLLSAGADIEWFKTNDGRFYGTNFPLEVQAGYSWPKYLDVYAEYSRYTSQSDTGNFTSKLTHEDYLIWARRFITRRWLINPYVALGLGADQERLARTLGGETNYQTGDLEFLTSVALGWRYQIWKITMTLEGRLSWSAGYAPNPLPGAGYQLGFDF